MRYDSNQYGTPTWAVIGYRSVTYSKFSASRFEYWACCPRSIPEQSRVQTSNNIDYLLDQRCVGKIHAFDPSSAKILWILSNSAKNIGMLFRHQLVEPIVFGHALFGFFFILCQHSLCREIFVGENRSLHSGHPLIRIPCSFATKVHILGSSQNWPEMTQLVIQMLAPSQALPNSTSLVKAILDGHFGVRHWKLPSCRKFPMLLYL